MGRYTTVQAYSDNNANMRSVSYAQASGSAEAKKGLVQPEKVENPYGSTAGAGSGDFHVYRHARAREAARLKELDEEEERKQLDSEYQSKVEEYRNEEEKRTAQRRKKRQRQKEAKRRKKNLKLAGVVAEQDEKPKEEGVEEEEFSYIPMSEQEKSEEKKESEENSAATTPKLEFANDGSFLEQMKKRLAEESNGVETKDATQPSAEKRTGESNQE